MQVPTELSADQPSKPHFVSAASIVLHLSGTNVANAGLGFAFWLAAARIMSPEEVGRGAATIALLALVSNASNFGVGIGLARFGADRRWDYRQLASASLLLTLGAATTLSAGLALLSAVGSSWLTSALAVVPWVLVIGAGFVTVAALLDAMAIAESDGRGVLLRNLIANGGKLLGLVVFASDGESLVIVTLVAILISVLAAARRRTMLSVGFWVRPRLPRIFLAYSMKQYVVTWALFTPYYVLTLIVAATLGPREAGFFAVAWGAASLLAAVGDAGAAAVLTTASKDLKHLALYVVRIGKPLTLAIVTLAVLSVIGAPLLNVLYGDRFGTAAMGNFRLVAVAAVPYAIVTLSIARFRVLGRSGPSLLLAALSGLGTCVGCLVLVALIGRHAPGWSYLGANCVSAAAAVALTRDWRHQ